MWMILVETRAEPAANYCMGPYEYDLAVCAMAAHARHQLKINKEQIDEMNAESVTYRVSLVPVRDFTA